MLKPMMNIKNRDTSRKQMKYIVALSKKGEGYPPIKLKVLTEKKIEKFLAQAQDETYIILKLL